MDFNDFCSYIKEHDQYVTPKRSKPSAFPSTRFYCKFVHETVREGLCSQRAGYDSTRINRGCFRMIQQCERIGGKVTINGLQHIRSLDHAPVIIPNHMSALETITLPAIILPFFKITYILKASLLKYPFLGKILRHMNVITVTRKSPRQDLKAVMDQGTKRLNDDGVGVVVFPQSSRTTVLNRAKFSSIGVRLARKAKAPVLPIAVRTDFMGNGKIFKDVGPVYTDRPIVYEIGEPFEVTDLKADNRRIMDFLADHMRSWGMGVVDE